METPRRYSFVFTGPATVNGVRVRRSLLEDAALRRGHNVLRADLTESADFVVTSSRDFMGRQGRKLRAADAANVLTISPDEFVALLALQVGDA